MSVKTRLCGYRRKKMNNKVSENVSIKARVKEYYWEYDYNCAITTLKILAEIFSVKLSDQVVCAAVGMHGAGKYGAQCGLVEGALMFLGIIGKERQLPEETIIDQCREFARQFEEKFHSLLCSSLRPQGFREDDPPHLCEELTCNAMEFSRDFVSGFIGGKRV